VEVGKEMENVVAFKPKTKKPIKLSLMGFLEVLLTAVLKSIL
jgi:hypothetical protein